jgi:hypothetical protein
LKKAEEDRKKEEAKAKRDELERKKKEELEKKQKLEEEKKRKLAEQKNLAAGKSIGKKGGKEEEGEEDDPIAKSLKERIAAGGLSEVVPAAKGGAKTVPGKSTATKPKEPEESKTSA